MRIILSPIGTVTTRFGAIDTSHPLRPHSGIDFAAPIGTPIHSPINGYVSGIVDYGSQNLGKGIFIKTDEGYQFIFGHLSKFDVRVGDVIHRGQIIGLSGNTGHSTGAHLHFGVKDPSGHIIDPHTVLHKIKTVVFDFDNIFQVAFAKVHNLFDMVMDTAVLV